MKIKRRKERVENELKIIDQKPLKEEIKKDKIEEKDEN